MTAAVALGKKARATSKTKAASLTANDIRLIPLSKLRLSPGNVRKDPPTGIEELAGGILQLNLLQNLVVTEADDGFFDVEAGGRRLAALQLLASDKRIPKDHPVPCMVVPNDSAMLASLMENVQRENMHPADEFAAFQALIDAGKSVEDVAAGFGVTPTVVRRRLRLANISPRLMADYRAGKVKLDHLMALTLTDDHAAQEAAFYDVPYYQREPHQLRERLTERKIDAGIDPLALFVTVAVYEAAGGSVHRDLFAEDNQGNYLEDAELLERLAQEKLATLSADVAAEGWAWVDVAPRATRADLNIFQRGTRTKREATEQEQARIDDLTRRDSEIDAILYGDDDEGELPEEESDALSEESERISAELASLRDSLYTHSAEVMAIAGAVLSIGEGGQLVVHRGLIRRDAAATSGDKAGSASASLIDNSVNDTGRSNNQKPKGALSEKLTQRLTAHCTAALQINMARQPHVALAVVVHGMVAQVLKLTEWNKLPVGIRLTIPHQPSLSAPELPETPAAKALEAMSEEWEQRLPEKSVGLLDALIAMSQDELVNLLALCSAMTVDVVSTAERSPRADELARALNLDMREWWTPTAASYFSHVSKVKILEAVTVVAPNEVSKLTNLKKGDLANEAERLLSGSGWLPSVMVPPAEPIGEEVEEG